MGGHATIETQRFRAALRAKSASRTIDGDSNIMSQNTEDPAIPNGANVDQGAGPELQAWAEFLTSTGQPALLDERDSTIWVPGVRAELQRMPSAATGVPDKGTIRRVLAQRGVWIASCLLEETPDRPANCFDYLRFGPDYELGELKKNARRDIRRGLRCFEVRRVDWDEVLRDGFDAYRDTEARHGHAPPHPDELKQMADRDRGCPCVELWGAIDDQGLAAWIRVLKGDDWAFIVSACSRLDALRDCPNNALAFTATHTFLVEEKLNSVSYGISSLQATDNVASLHRFKLRMGFSPVRRYRQFVVHPVLRPLLSAAPASWCWDRLARLRPSSGTLSKVAGLSKLLSGRKKSPLQWAQELKH